MRVLIPPRQSSGSALLIAVIFSGLLGLALASFLTLTTNDVRSTARSETWNLCMPVLEAGIEEALTHCYYNFNTNLATNGWVLTNGVYCKSNNVYQPAHGKAVGQVAAAGYYLTKISQTQPYVITSTGYVPLTGKGTYISRTVQVGAALQGA